MVESSLPLIAVTVGDPAGIGPEVVVKALADRELWGMCRPLVVGPLAVVEAACRRFAPSLRPVAVAREGLAGLSGDMWTVPVWDVPAPGVEALPPGVPSPLGGTAAVRAVEEAAALCLSRAVGGMATAPINKEAVHLAGYAEIGHQEVLARVSGATEIATMLVAGPLRAVHLTTHVPLREAASHVRRERVLARLRLTHRSFTHWGMPQPRIAVAALNPHGGDGGLLGREEIEELAPAVADARAEGVLASGPIPADSVFLRALAGEFDVVLVLYHDQGHIPVKMHDFHASVSVNLGLPFVRTSVDHGTAYDIAGKGVADARSMAEAVRMAARLVAGQGLAITPQAIATLRR
ncbi:MAG: 4-hydroxythreonine-4-phosphate dehydrogenase PdxA [Chloroflexi bacterium]|nr:4-hydroxythreonine-4-phosphate dehydrogenase PdxA [Chloroflexota bacterium]